MTGADTAHELKALALRMAVVVDVLENRSQESAAGMSGARVHLDDAVQRLGQRSTALLQEVATGVQSATRAAAEEALGPPAATLKTQVAAVLRSLQDSTRQLALEREAFGRQQRRALWIGAGALVLGALMVVGASAAWVAMKRKELAQMEFAKQIHAATAAGALVPCGDELCARIGASPRKAGKNGEYVVVE